jgi:hypothetical protein
MKPAVNPYAQMAELPYPPPYGAPEGLVAQGGMKVPLAPGAPPLAQPPMAAVPQQQQRAHAIGGLSAQNIV